MKIQFKPATRLNTAQILELMQLYYHEDHLLFDLEKAKKSLNLILEDSSFGEIYLFYDDESFSLKQDVVPLGYFVMALGFSMECGGPEAFVDEIFVREDSRGKGIGSQALKFFIHRCKEKNIAAIRLETTRHNDKAMKLYQRLGFEDTGRTLLAYWTGLTTKSY